MKKEDESIFEYRMKKQIQNSEFILHEQIHGRFEKTTVFTKLVGYVDLSIYRPKNYDGASLLPMVFNFHGGGFVLGFYELDGKYCQKLADLTGAAIINVDYCLAPEHKFPKAILSSYEVMCSMKKTARKYNLDACKIMVMGHSAGGNIAVGLGLIDKDLKELEIKGLIVDYAPLKQSISEEDRKVDCPSKAISRSRMMQYMQWYFNDMSELDEPLASPLYADLKHLPRTLVISASLDSLCEEECEFVERARDNEVEVIHKIFQECQHGFTHEELKEYRPKEAREAWELMADFIKQTLK